MNVLKQWFQSLSNEMKATVLLPIVLTLIAIVFTMAYFIPFALIILCLIGLSWYTIYLFIIDA